MAYRFNILALAAFAAPALALPFDDGFYHPGATKAATSVVPEISALPVASDTFVPSLPSSTGFPSVQAPTSIVSATRHAISSQPTVIVSATKPVISSLPTVIVSGTKATSSSIPTSAAGTSAAAVPTDTTNAGSSAAPGTRKSFTGDGSVGAGWPDQKDWLSFDAIWKANLNAISTGCVAPATQNTQADIDAIKAGITAESASTGVDNRFILATIIQESHGCVRVGHTESQDQINNPGIMQSHNGQHNCADGGECTAENIQGQIADGTAGTADGRGLQQEIEASKALGGATVAQQAYIAMRLYNSGDNSYTKGADLSVGGATSSYSSDIANRLLGVVF